MLRDELIETENDVKLDSVDGFITMDTADKLKSNKCSKCDLSFAKKHNLKVHIRTVHEGQKPFKCTICDASFARSGNLKKHVATVHERKKPFQCTLCGVSWRVSHNCANKTSLKTHDATVHEDQKPFKCTMSRSENLKKHIAVVNEGLKPFRCTICDASFSQRESMNKHFLSFHKNQIRSVKDIRSVKK